MSDKKQTAVQWLRGEAIKLVVEAMQGTLNKDTLEHQIRQIVTKAMAMEREQIVDAYTANSVIRIRTKAEQYYNETYGEKFGEKFGGQDESNH